MSTFVCIALFIASSFAAAGLALSTFFSLDPAMWSATDVA